MTGYELQAEGSELEFLYGKNFSLLQIIQSSSAAHPTSYLMGIGGRFP
jgi:hypothetical protein